MDSKQYLELISTVITEKEKKGARYEEVVTVVRELMSEGKITSISNIMKRTGIKHYSQVYLMVKDSEKKGKELKKVVVKGNTLIIVE